MNTREQYLSMRIQRLENELKAALMVLDRVLADHELNESVACAFAWDLSDSIEAAKEVYESSDPGWNAADSIDADVRKDWDTAVKALENQNREGSRGDK